MARCSRCNKFMLLGTSSGYCKECEIIVKQEARRRAEEEKKRQDEELRKKAAEEERQRRAVAAQQKAEQERKEKAELEKRRLMENQRQEVNRNVIRGKEHLEEPIISDVQKKNTYNDTHTGNKEAPAVTGSSTVVNIALQSSSKIGKEDNDSIRQTEKSKRSVRLDTIVNHFIECCP